MYFNVSAVNNSLTAQYFGRSAFKTISGAKYRQFLINYESLSYFYFNVYMINYFSGFIKRFYHHFKKKKLSLQL